MVHKAGEDAVRLAEVPVRLQGKHGCRLHLLDGLPVEGVEHHLQDGQLHVLAADAQTVQERRHQLGLNGHTDHPAGPGDDLLRLLARHPPQPQAVLA